MFNVNKDDDLDLMSQFELIGSNQKEGNQKRQRIM